MSNSIGVGSVIEIQKVGLEAAALLAELHAACLAPAWNEQMIAGLLASPGGRAWIASLEGQPVGFSIVRQAADEAEILAIGVLPSERRSGIGRMLLASTANDCATAGMSRLYLEVAVSNSEAIKIYEAVGFLPVGSRKCYYRIKEMAEDAVIMRLDLL